MAEEKYKKIFSKNLRYYMYINKKSQIDLINDLGFNKSAVSTWCNGTRLPRMDKVEQLARYFNCNRSDLIEDKSKNENSEPDYYLDPKTREIAEFLHKNPDYKVLFDASMNVKPEDIDFVKKMIDKFSE